MLIPRSCFQPTNLILIIDRYRQLLVSGTDYDVARETLIMKKIRIFAMMLF